MSDYYYICKNGHEIDPPNALYRKEDIYCPKCGEPLEVFKEPFWVNPTVHEIMKKAHHIFPTRPFWKAKNLLSKLKIERTHRNLTAAGMALRLVGYVPWNSKKGIGTTWHRPEQFVEE